MFLRVKGTSPLPSASTYLRATIVHGFQPFSLSCVMQIAVEGVRDQTFVLKVFDLRFSQSLREEYKAPLWDTFRETEYHDLVKSGRVIDYVNSLREEESENHRRYNETGSDVGVTGDSTVNAQGAWQSDSSQTALVAGMTVDDAKDEDPEENDAKDDNTGIEENEDRETDNGEGAHDGEEEQSAGEAEAFLFKLCHDMYEQELSTYR